MLENRANIKRILQRRRFVGLMDLYDRNFALINKLIHNLDELPNSCMTQLSDYPDLYLEIQERCKFTTMLKLTYWFPLSDDASDLDQELEMIADPDLDIRIYHDAKSVEAMSCKPKGFMPISKEAIGEKQHLDCRWDSNLFLNKWLEYMVSVGYQFRLNNISNSKPFAEIAVKDYT